MNKNYIAILVALFMIIGSGCSSGWHIKGIKYKDLSITEIGSDGNEEENENENENDKYLNRYSSKTPRKQILFYEGCHYQVNNIMSTVDLRSGGIKHTGPEGTSGTIRLVLWATKQPYSIRKGGIGFLVGEARVGSLKNGTKIDNIFYRVHHSAPPYGTYYMTLTIQEWKKDGWVTRDACLFRDKATYSF